MGDLTKQIAINAPVQAVFSYIANPYTAPTYVTAITRVVAGPEVATAVGQRWQAHVNFLGRQTVLWLRLTEFEALRSVRFAMESEPNAVLTLRLAARDAAHTDVAMTLEVPSVPNILLAGVMNNVLASNMDMLKRAVESTPA